MTAWRKSRLGDCCDIVSGATPSTSVADYWDGDIFWATPKDLSGLDTHYISDTPRKLTEAGLASCSARILPVNSVLFSSRAPIGHVAINTVPMATNQGFKSLVPGPEVDAKFLFHWLRANRTYLEGLGVGATFKEVSKAVVSKVEVPLPPVPEQRRIAAILDKADALRTKRSEALAQLDRLSQAIFVEMFGDPVANPKNYPTAPLVALVEPERGITYGIVQRGDDCDEGVPVLRIRDLADDEIDATRLKKTSPEVSSQYRRTILRGGEIAISIRGTVGRCCIVPSNLAGGNVSREIALIPVRSSVSAVFVQQVLRSTSVQRLIADDIKGVAQSGINLEDLRELQVLQPPAAEVSAFDARAKLATRLLRDGMGALAKLDQLAATLRHRAFLGEL